LTASFETRCIQQQTRHISTSKIETSPNEDCLREAQAALKLRPDYPEAYNNIAAAYQAMGPLGRRYSSGATSPQA
jgi:TPR repeat